MLFCLEYMKEMQLHQKNVTAPKITINLEVRSSVNTQQNENFQRLIQSAKTGYKLVVVH